LILKKLTDLVKVEVSESDVLCEIDKYISNFKNSEVVERLKKNLVP
jgi:hypothetical protein